MIGAIYPKHERNRAIGVWAAASALTTAGGPVLGGWLVETFGWQSVFWINPLLALVVVGLLVAFAPADRRELRQFDVIGAAIECECSRHISRRRKTIDARRDRKSA